MIRLLSSLLLLLLPIGQLRATDAEQLYYALRTKALSVKDYTAQVKMKIDINYMRIPLLKGTLYFKAPDKMRMERQGGISILPKKNMNLTITNLIPQGKVVVIDAGSATIDGKPARMLKVIPEDDKEMIVLTLLWVDEEHMLALKAETTTRNEGTMVMELQYGKYTSYMLPDKVTVTVDVKEYKLPKGVTMDYSEIPQNEKKEANGKDGRKGTIQITYLSYAINTGLSDAVFERKDE